MRKLVYQISVTLLTLLLLGLMTCAGDLDYQMAVWRSMSSGELNNTNLKYTISLSPNRLDPKLKIEISLLMPASVFFLQLPNQFLRKERLFDRIENLQVSGPGAFLESNENYEFIKAVHGEEGKPLKITYMVRYNDAKRPGPTKSFSAPIIDNNFFMFVGSMALIIPAGLQENSNEFSVEFDWNVPDDFQIYNSFGARNSEQKVMASGVDLWDSLFIGGNQIRSYKESVNNRPVYVTMEGRFNFISDAQLVNIITKLLKTQRDTWRDSDFPYFFVNFMAMGNGCNGQSAHRFAGTAHRDSFRAFFPSDCALQPNMVQLISHELNHMFIGKKLKMGEQRGQIDGKWFSEGWNDFFGRLLAYRAGVLSQQEYFMTLNKALTDYQLSSQRTVPLAKLVSHMYKKPYTSQALEQLPYQQGELMAWELNKKIKEKTGFKKSLDDAVRDMLSEAKGAGGSKKFSPQELASIIDRYAPGAFENAYQKIEYGRTPFAPSWLAKCSDLRQVNYYDNRAATKSIPVNTYSLFLNDCDRWLN